MYNFKTQKEPFTRGYINCESQNKSKKSAAGMLLAAKEDELYIDVKLGLCYKNSDPASYYGFTGLKVSCEDYEKLAEKYPEEKEDFEYMKKVMEPQLTEQFPPYSKAQEAHLIEAYLFGGIWEGHANPDHADVCRYGTDALRAKIEKYRAVNPGKDDF